jgi:hypothetical protein
MLAIRRASDTEIALDVEESGIELVLLLQVGRPNHSVEFECWKGL